MSSMPVVGYKLIEGSHDFAMVIYNDKTHFALIEIVKPITEVLEQQRSFGYSKFTETYYTNGVVHVKEAYPVEKLFALLREK